MSVATSIIQGKKASPELAAEAVRIAMEKIKLTTCNSVLLLLSTEFANDPLQAIKAVAREANCMQVVGCTAIGIFTEEDWVLDAPAVAVMVFGSDIHLKTLNTSQPHTTSNHESLLTITAPNAIDSTWLNNGKARYGGVSGDALGLGAYSVWQNAKGEAKGFIEGFFTSVNGHHAVSHGLQHLSLPQQISQLDGFDVTKLKLNHSEVRAFSHLEKAWRLYDKNNQTITLHQLMALYADSEEAFKAGDFQQTSLISMDEASQSITLASTLKVGQWLAWAVRKPEVVTADLQVTCDQIKQQLNSSALFGLLFSCLGRGPYFYDGTAQDLNTIKAAFPEMPFIGFYGNGEIAQVCEQNQLLAYSAVFSVFSHTP
jgi:small ligand-binding sensory domain FIST